jgi:hypothetical protein
MSEVEYPTKTCMQCGTKCDLLVLVCPNCSEVLPDGKLPVPEAPTYEFSPDRLSPNEIRRTELRPHESSNEFTPLVIRESESNNLAIGKIVLFIIAFAIVIWLLGPGK